MRNVDGMSFERYAIAQYRKTTHKWFMSKESIPRFWRNIRWPSVKINLDISNENRNLLILCFWFCKIIYFSYKCYDTLGPNLCIFMCSIQSEDKNLNSRNKVKYLSQVIKHSIEYYSVMSFRLLYSNVIRCN